MTIQDVYKAVLIELNKVQAPSILLEDFCYFYNKAVQQYINMRYNLFETSQQLTDDLRVLVKTDVAAATGAPLKLRDTKGQLNVFGANYSCDLPDDYLHILNCICEFEDIGSGRRCYDDGNTDIQIGASKLDTSQWSGIITNYYMQPSYKRPYFYIVNIDDPNPEVPGHIPNMDKIEGNRYGNTTKPIMQIKCGSSRKYRLKKVYIDYLRAPQFIELTQDELDKVGDESYVLEFPDYVINEIINVIVGLIMENQSNPRIQSHPGMTTSIVSAGASK